MRPYKSVSSCVVCAKKSAFLNKSQFIPFRLKPTQKIRHRHTFFASKLYVGKGDGAAIDIHFKRVFAVGADFAKRLVVSALLEFGRENLHWQGLFVAALQIAEGGGIGAQAADLVDDGLRLGVPIDAAVVFENFWRVFQDAVGGHKVALRRAFGVAGANLFNGFDEQSGANRH